MAPSGFIIKTFIKELLVFLSFRKFRRSDSYVKHGYNLQRQKKEELLSKLTLENYIQHHASDGFCLLDDVFVYNCQSIVHSRLLVILEHWILKGLPGNVVELGSGDGRNLLFLAAKYKEISFLGLDFSPTSIKLAEKAALRYNITNITFKEADLAKDSFEDLLDNSYVFSMHCLEEMPRTFKNVLKVISRSSALSCQLIEPIYLQSQRGPIQDITRLLRIFNRDRLRGFKNAASQILTPLFRVEYIDLRLGVNPFNPSSLASITRRGL